MHLVPSFLPRALSRLVKPLRIHRHLQCVLASVFRARFVLLKSLVGTCRKRGRHVLVLALRV